MTFKSRTSAIRSHLPVSRLLVLFAFSVVVTWILVYLRMVDYFVGEGIEPDQIGYGNIAFEVFDANTVFFGLIVFVAAGIVPLAILFIRANPIRSNIAQIVWAASIVGLLLIAKATSQCCACHFQVDQRLVLADSERSPGR